MSTITTVLSVELLLSHSTANLINIAQFLGSNKKRHKKCHEKLQKISSIYYYWNCGVFFFHNPLICRLWNYTLLLSFSSVQLHTFHFKCSDYNINSDMPEIRLCVHIFRSFLMNCDMFIHLNMVKSRFNWIYQSSKHLLTCTFLKWLVTNISLAFIHHWNGKVLFLR